MSDLPETPPPPRRRFIHAGLLPTEGNVFNAYFGFVSVHDKTTGEFKWQRLIYAPTPYGGKFGSYGEGELKINDMTWDSHIRNRWSHYLRPTGTWLKGQKGVGRKCRYEILKKIWNDPGFIDPYPNGLITGTLGPKVNVIFAPHNLEPCNPKPVYVSNPSNDLLSSLGLIGEGEEDAEFYFPGTKITLTSCLILREEYRKLKPLRPKDIIIRFLKGRLPLTNEKILQQVESAFFKLSLRIDRQAAKRASEQAIRNKQYVLHTKAWKSALPYALPSCKIDDFHELVQNIENAYAKRRQGRRDTAIEALLNETRGRGRGRKDSSYASNASDSSAQASASIPTTSNTYFPSTRILCDPSSIIQGIYKEVSPSATEVISRFLSGKIHAQIRPEGLNHSTMAQIESAFYKKGFRINTGAALRASMDVKNGHVDMIIDSEAWQLDRPVKLRPAEHNDVDGMLQGLESLFCYHSDDDGGEFSEAENFDAKSYCPTPQRKRKRDLSVDDRVSRRSRSCPWNCANNPFADGNCDCVSDLNSGIDL